MKRMTDKQMLAFSYVSSFMGLGAAWTFWVARMFV